MKCEQSERYVLLEQSGEITAWGRRRLAAHLRDCEACRRQRDEVLHLTAAARVGLPNADLDTFTLERIKGAAAARARPAGEGSRTPADETFAAWWRPALVYAALVALLAAGLLLVRQQVPRPQYTEATKAAPETSLPAALAGWDGELDEQIAELGDMVAAIGGEAEVYEKVDEEQDPDAIARELLALEGSS